MTMTQPLFPLGAIVMTSAARDTLLDDDVMMAIVRHSRGDWGDVCQQDWNTNDEAVKQSDRILSAYHTDSGVKFWIITDAGHSVTTVLLPTDY